jgi:hypothetical protein
MQPEVNAGPRKGGRIKGANGLIFAESINREAWERAPGSRQESSAMRKYFAIAAVMIAGLFVRCASGQAQKNSGVEKTKLQETVAQPNGQHDFDPLIGSWKYHLKRRLNPLTGSKTWVELDGTGVCYKVWDGRAQLDTIEVEGPTGHIEGLTVRLYNPQSHQWSLYWANSKEGALSDPPQIGEFKNGHGEFFAQVMRNGGAILVRYDWSGMTSNSPHFEQSFSDDGGKTWEVNWITDQTRVKDEPGGTGASDQRTSADRDAPHDFDFETGAWKTHLSRRLHPLTGSSTWTELEGTTTVRKIWNGRANLVELEVDGATGHIEALSLRLYNPQARQWSLNFASSNSGSLSVPTIGDFKNGRGEFYDQETLGDRAIFVRFVISDITTDSCHFEQAFSDDGGKTWEVNWIATDTRVREDAAGTAR